METFFKLNLLNNKKFYIQRKIHDKTQILKRPYIVNVSINLTSDGLFFTLISDGGGGGGFNVI